MRQKKVWTEEGELDEYVSDIRFGPDNIWPRLADGILPALAWRVQVAQGLGVTHAGLVSLAIRGLADLVRRADAGDAQAVKMLRSVAKEAPRQFSPMFLRNFRDERPGRRGPLPIRSIAKDIRDALEAFLRGVDEMVAGLAGDSTRETSFHAKFWGFALKGLPALDAYFVVAKDGSETKLFRRPKLEATTRLKTSKFVLGGVFDYLAERIACSFDSDRERLEQAGASRENRVVYWARAIEKRRKARYTRYEWPLVDAHAKATLVVEACLEAAGYSRPSDLFDNESPRKRRRGVRTPPSRLPN